MNNQRPRTLEDQIAILKQRGMEFMSEHDARALLARASYFRLKYYWIDMMEEGTDDFKDGSCFDDVIDGMNSTKNFGKSYLTQLKLLK